MHLRSSTIESPNLDVKQTKLTCIAVQAQAEVEELKKAASSHDRERASLAMARTRLSQATTDLDRLRFENEVCTTVIPQSQHPISHRSQAMTAALWERNMHHCPHGAFLDCSRPCMQ